ncbi:hypothetical protein BV25DRAFT_1824211 [Artomyces pyxidatus]|uniref:Uncharacterized protein n=1 Tax=Artomyces pyxidatus TaxID=48021 RepID=A0ACB8T685_9AGAM|nr:hypothetical protein BV25DRAFT_1824211 [Artomyces pyxidatus]
MHYAVFSRGTTHRFQSGFYHTVRHASASSSTNPYPYPAHANPTPQQIFHLPMDASQSDVKARYYELVKIYHPDSTVARAYPPEVAQARFHAISTSYDVLRGRKRNTAIGEDGGASARPDSHDLSFAVWRAKQQRRADLNIPHDDRWKDRVFFGALILTLGVFFLQTTVAKQRTLGEALRSRHSTHESGRPDPRGVSKRDEELLSAPDLGSSRTPS